MKNNTELSERNKTGPVGAVVLENEYVIISHDEATSLLLLKWKRQITLEERQKIFLWAYGFSKTENIKNWLIDDEAIYIITPEEKAWVTNIWTKLVANSGIEKIAVVTTDNFPNLQANASFTTSAQEKYRQHGTTEHEVFTEYHLAYQWLLEGY